MNYIRTMVGTCVLTLILPGAMLWAGGSEEGTAAAGDQSMPAAASGGTYSEAPMLARMVAAGELPPVDERLPDIPVVAGPGVLNGTQYLDWKPGKYSDGRTLRTVALSTKVSIPGHQHQQLPVGPRAAHQGHDSRPAGGLQHRG